MGAILKQAKVEVAVKKSNSAMIVTSPTQRSCDNYSSLLPQLEPIRSVTSNVQTKSEAKYIAETSFRNAVSHALAVAVAHYQLGVPDKRFKNIEKATAGAQQLYKLVFKENDGQPIRVVNPMFISTTDDTTLFIFEGKVNTKEKNYS